MALFNYATKEITLKIVYYGPGLSGKTTNLQHLHSMLSPASKGKLLSLSTEADRTLFFDFLPVELGKIRDFAVRFQLYTVPGQVRYNATRKVVLKGADAVVFVADSQEAMKDQNIESFDNMRENLRSNNINPDTIPVLLQFNKRDLSNVMPVEEMNKDLNPNSEFEFMESIATKGAGVEESFRAITRLLLKDISRKHRIEVPSSDRKETSAAEPPKTVAEPAPLPLSAAEPSMLPPVPEAALLSSTEEIEGLEAAGEIPDKEDVMSIPESVSAVSLKAETAMNIPQAVEVAMKTPPPPLVQADIFPELKEAVVSPPEKKADDIKPGKMSFRDSIAEALPKTRVERTPPPRPLFEASGASEPSGEALPPRGASSPETARFDRIAADAVKLSSSLERTGLVVAEIRNTISSLKADLSSLKSDVAALRSEVAALKAAPAQTPPPQVDPKVLKGIQREQAEIIASIREISQILGNLQEKKSWFKF